MSGASTALIAQIRSRFTEVEVDRFPSQENAPFGMLRTCPAFIAKNFTSSFRLRVTPDVFPSSHRRRRRQLHHFSYPVKLHTAARRHYQSFLTCSLEEPVTANLLINGQHAPPPEPQPPITATTYPAHKESLPRPADPGSVHGRDSGGTSPYPPTVKMFI